MNSTIHSQLRGHRIFFNPEKKQWLYSDNLEPSPGIGDEEPLSPIPGTAEPDSSFEEGVRFMADFTLRLTDK